MQVMEAGAAAPLVFFLLPRDTLLPAWPGQQVDRLAALGRHLFYAGAEKGGGGAHGKGRKALLQHALAFVACILLLPGVKGGKAQPQHAPASVACVLLGHYRLSWLPVLDRNTPFSGSHWGCRQRKALLLIGEGNWPVGSCCSQRSKWHWAFREGRKHETFHPQEKLLAAECCDQEGGIPAASHSSTRCSSASAALQS
ncbi:hypothetical protein E2320_011194, partial [Naja naja]